MIRITLDDACTKNFLALWLPITFVLHIAIWIFASPFLPIANDKILGMLQTMLGLHGGWTAMVVGYYFNSSASSARKDEIIAASNPVAPPTKP